MFELLAAALAIVAFIFSRKALDQVGTLRMRIEQLEARLGAAPVTTPVTAEAATPESTTVAEPFEQPPMEAFPVAPETSRAEPPAPIAPQTPVAAEPTPEPAAEPTVSPEPAPPAMPEAIAANVDAQQQEPAGPSLEERLGTRWVVWLGGLMLALGGLFLVRYSIEEGLLGPGVRIVLGALFAATLLGLGEWSRRKETLSNIVQIPIANIPAILTAAGTAVAFGVTYAAYALYGFLDPAIAFVLLGAVALGTLALSLLHGPALAGLGVVGGFVTPLLVSSTTPNFWALYIYLAVVTAAALALARVRLWRWLAITTVALGLLWLLPLLAAPAYIAPHAFHLIASFALVAAFVVAGLLFGPDNKARRIDPVSSGVLIAWLVGATMFALVHLQDATALTVFAVLVAATLAIAFRSEAAAAAVPAAGLLAATVFAVWYIQTRPGAVVLTTMPDPALFLRSILSGSGVAPTTMHLGFGLGLMALFGIGSFLAQGRHGSAQVATLWSATGAATPIAILIALYGGMARFEHSMSFALGAAVMALAYAFATEQMVRRETRAGQYTALASYATAALTAVALALTFALEKGWLTVSLALIAPAAAWVSTKRPIPFLRWLAGGLALVVTARLGYDPRVVGSDVGTTPVFNWLLWGYGVPAVAFGLAGWIMRRKANDKPAGMAESAAIVFTTLLVFLEIRHFMTGGNIYASQSGLTEVALHVCSALAMAVGWERLSQKTGSNVHRIGAVVLTGLAAAGASFGLLFLEMPLFTRENVGGAFFNLLLLAYALPALLATLLSRIAMRSRPQGYVNAIAGMGLALGVVYVLLQIRCFFHGPVLSAGATSTAEVAVVVCALLAMAIGLEYLAGRLGEAVHKVGAVALTALAGLVMLIALLGTRMPAMTGEPIEAAWLNLLLLSYAAPALLAFGLSKIAAGHRPVNYVHALTAAALALGTVYVMLQIKRFFQGPIMTGEPSTAEIAVQASVLIAMAIGLEVLTKRFGNLVHNYGALVLTGLAGILVFVLVGLRLPILTGEPVGGAFFNLVMLAYAVPAVLIAALSKTAAGRRPSFYVDGLAGGALILMLIYVSLEIRTLYHGSVLLGPTTQAEQYTYSVAWLAFGVALLGAGLALQSQRARLASAVVIGLTVLKVFFIDMGGLTGVWRALSFIGLGLVLVAIGWFYQRILFPKRAAGQV